MELTIINAFNITDAWFKCLEKCISEEKGVYTYKIEKGSYEGKYRKEFDQVLINIKNPGFKPLVPEVPEGVPPPCSIDQVNTYALEYIYLPTKRVDEQYTYGERINEGNQLEEVIAKLQKSKETNQTCIEVAKPSDMNLDDPPCLRLIDVRVRYGAVHFFIYFRSWDLYSGLPVNLGGLQILKEHIAKNLDLQDGTLNAWSKGLHLYDFQWAHAKKVVEGTPTQKRIMK